jgi:hypothetical protein
LAAFDLEDVQLALSGNRRLEIAQLLRSLAYARDRLAGEVVELKRQVRNSEFKKEALSPPSFDSCSCEHGSDGLAMPALDTGSDRSGAHHGEAGALD